MILVWPSRDLRLYLLKLLTSSEHVEASNGDVLTLKCPNLPSWLMPTLAFSHYISMKSLGGCTCVCRWLCHLQPSFSTLKIILRLHSSLTISRTNFVSCKTRWLNGWHTAVNRWSFWWFFPLILLWHQLYMFLRPQHHLVIFCSGL